jgi:hypothetical protein
MLMFLVLYGVVAMGNHYDKVYCLIANFLYLLVFVANGLFVILLFFSRRRFLGFFGNVVMAKILCSSGIDNVLAFSKLAT